MKSKRLLGALLILLLGIPAASYAQTGTTATTTPAKAPISVNEEGLPLVLEIDGQQLEGFTLAGALDVKRPLVEATCSPDGICTGDLRLAIDDLDRAADQIEEKSRHDTVKNAIGNIRALAVELDEVLDADSDDDGLLDRVYGPGDAHYGNITLKRGFSGDRTLQAWFDEVATGKNIRKSISVIVRKRDGSEAARYNLLDCFPVSWGVSYQQGGMIEKIEIAVEKIERAEITVDEEGVRKAPITAILEADGEVMGTFELASDIAGAISWNGGVDDDCDGVMACPADRPVRCGDGACTAPAVAALDRLAEQVTGIGDRAKHDIAMNAIRNMKARMAEVETLLAGAKRPGRVKYGNITLKRGLSGSDPVMEWITDTTSGKPWKRNMTLILQGQDGKEIARFSMDGGPVRYHLAAEGSTLVWTLEVRVDRIEMK